ncbi:SPOR domain-containing protein [Rhodalgimonas zhirmunskyi]|nr:SPOR domain-containing protein [Rhodoalgimonas zhirmunskyi]
MALVVGIGVWGYKTLSRDVSGVPVVRAATAGPMRVQPEEPGGEPALNQGLAVNKVAAEGAAEKPADRLQLAPSPVALSDEDQPTGASVEVAAVQDQNRTQSAGEAIVPPQMDDIRALADRLSHGASPLEGNDAAAKSPESAEAAPETLQTAAAIMPAKPEVATEKTQEPIAAPAPVNKIKGGLKSSVRPKIRPAALKRASASAIASAVPAVGPDATAAAIDAVAGAEVDPATIPAGTRLAQLGAFDSADTARKEWARLATKFEDYLEGKQRVIQKASSGGRTFYRLRAMGFADLADARRFCSALVAERADCIPLTTK